MCGIAAMFAYGREAAPLDAGELQQITSSMIPRGPDAGGTWLADDGRVALGSRRLAIIDLSDEATQPMWDVDGQLVIVFNGEIYNYRELRASLERGGQRFHSQSDTEVLLGLYRRDGERMVDLLRGMFAFAIWDTRKRRMFVARDPYGIKPLYIVDDGSTIRMASEVKALLAGGRVSTQRDPAAIAGFLLTGSVPEPFTTCKAIRAIEAGTCFAIEEERGVVDTRKHYSIASIFRQADSRRAYTRLADPTVLLREAVDESVCYHLVADVPVGVFLSAGIDSSVIALIAAQHTREQLHTFTLAFDEFRGKRADESPLAERFARELDARHTTRIVTREEFEADLPRFLGAMDQPTIDGINTWFVSKAVHEAGVKVALSGLGGDEMFGSYPSFKGIPRTMQLARIPLAANAAAIISRHPKARQLGRYATSEAGAYLLQRGLFLPEELPAILGDQLAKDGLERLDPIEHIEAALVPRPQTTFARIATLESSLYMRNQLLRDSDWASMAHSVEVRTPLVDAALLRQTAPLLLEIGRKGKSIIGANLPAWLRDRPKSGFFVPMREWGNLPPDGTPTRMRSWALRVIEQFA
jgi:asparagine synthase (glutamine-hydrolysing)